MAAVQAGAAAGQDEHKLWNDCFSLGQELVDAHIHRLRMEEFAALLENVDPDCPASGALRRLATLYAIEHAPHPHAWYLTEGHLRHDEVRGLSKTINALCAQLTPEIPILLENLTLPDELLDDPIAHPNYLDLL